jgi:hypothetical protein
MGLENLKNLGPEIEKKPEKIINDNELMNLTAENLPVAIWSIHEKIENKVLRDLIESKLKYIYKLKDHIILKRQNNSEEYLLEIEFEGNLTDFGNSYGEVLKEKINELSLNSNKDTAEVFKIEEWSRKFFVFEETENQIEEVSKEDFLVKYQHEGKFVINGESNF